MNKTLPAITNIFAVNQIIGCKRVFAIMFIFIPTVYIFFSTMALHYSGVPLKFVFQVGSVFVVRTHNGLFVIS